MEIIKIAAICLVAAVLAKVIQPSNRDLAALLSISAVIFAAFLAIDGVSEVVAGVDGILGGIGVNKKYVEVAFRALGICYICELCSSSCRDCGESALGSVLDFSGRAAASLLCLPLLKEFIDLVRRILEI